MWWVYLGLIVYYGIWKLSDAMIDSKSFFLFIRGFLSGGGDRLLFCYA